MIWPRQCPAVFLCRGKGVCGAGVLHSMAQKEYIIMENKIENLTAGNVTRQMLRFAWPLFLANLLQSFYSIVDMVAVGQFVGGEGLAAVSNASVIVFLITSLCTGITMGGTVLVAQYEGARSTKHRSQSVGTLFTLSAAASAIVTVVSLLVCRPVFQWMQVPETAMRYAQDYMQVISLGIVFVFGYNAVCAVLRGMGNSRSPLCFVVAATVVNVGLDILLIGVFRMGTRGAAIATVTSQGISFLVAALYLKRRSFAPLTRGDLFKKDKARLILKIGLPAAGQMAVLNLSYMIATAMLNTFGVAVAAASGVGLKVNTFAVMPIWAVGQAVTAMAGQNMGAGDVERAARVGKTGAWMCVIASMVMTAIFQLFAEQVIGLFNTDPEVLHEGVLYLRICCSLNCAAYAVMYAYNAFATGLGDSLFAFFNSLLDCVVIRIFGSLLLGFVLGYGFVGIYAAEMFAPVPPAIVAAVYFCRGRWKQKRLISA